MSLVPFGEKSFLPLHMSLIASPVHTINYGMSPCEKLYVKLLDYSSVRVFRFTCFILWPHTERTKLFLKYDLCVFLGYGIGKKGYRCCEPTSQKLYVSRPVTFLESISFYSIPVLLYNVTQSELLAIYPFSIDSDDFSSYASAT